MSQNLLSKRLLTATLLTLPFALVAGDTPGMFKIPGTDTSLKIYGFAELNGTYDMGSFNTDIDDYDWASCLMSLPFDNPTANQAYAQRKNSLYMTARTSRLGFMTVTPSAVGNVTMVFEGDFNSPSPSNFSSPTTTNGNTFRVRKAYGQIGNFLFGQTWSTFFDGDSLPDTVDFNEVPSATLERQPMLQYTFTTSSKSNLAIAMELPFNRQFLGASGHVASQTSDGGNGNDTSNGGSGNISTLNTPDLIANYTFSDKWGHISVRGVVIPYQGGGNLLANGTTTKDLTATGFGGAVSGHFNISGDSLVWSVTGGPGVGRYMFGSLFQSAYNDGTKMNLWTGMGWHVGYTHNWDSKWRSNIIYSQVNMSDNTSTGVSGMSLAQLVGTGGGGADLQPNKTLTNALFNTFYQITKSTYCGFEYNYGTRKTFAFNQVGETTTAIPQYTGTMKRVNFVFHVSFF